MASSPPDTAYNGFATLTAKLRGYDQRRREDWAGLYTQRASDIPADAERAWLRREKASHRGIGERRSLRHLVATAVDQPFLDEICRLDGLERLDLEWPMTAADLSGLRHLTRLTHVGLNSPLNVTDFTPLLALPRLRRLFIENAKHVRDVEWLADAHHLESLGVEGSLWTKQRLTGVGPFAGLRGVRGLFLTSVRLEAKDLTPLADCPRLELLGCARFAPRAQFERLHRQRPELKCTWFDPLMWTPS
ncbi:MAG: hypothetical protein ACXWUP_12125 [Allosphingosinicella sp.]